jgi:hypothetical protein
MPAVSLLGLVHGQRNSALHRSVRQQSCRVRSRTAEGEVAADAEAKAGPQRQGYHRWHAFVQNLQRGHYELSVEEPADRRLAVAFDELALAI